MILQFPLIKIIEDAHLPVRIDQPVFPYSARLIEAQLQDEIPLLRAGREDLNQ